MGLTEQISAYDQKPYARVTINGVEYYNWTNITRQVSYDQLVASAKVTTPNRFNMEPGMVYPIQIFEGYNGYSQLVFTGYIDDVEQSRFPNEFDLVCSDVLKKAQETWLDDTGVTYTSTQAETAVVALLALAGLTNVQAATSNFTIGDTHPTEFKLVSVLDACNQIAGLIGWALWATADGTVHFRHKKPLPGASVFWTYREASSLTATDGNIIGKFKHTKTDKNLRNKAIVIGYGDIREEYAEGSQYVPSPPTYRTMILSSEIIDTSSMASAFAKWMVKDCNHLWESAAFTIPGNPYLGMGQTIKLIESRSGNNSNYFVFAINSNMGKGQGYTMDLVVCGGNASPRDDDDGDEKLPPVASFTVFQIAWGDPTYVVYVDGSASYAPDSTISSYDWDWGDLTAHGSGVKTFHKYATTGTYTIILTVTAANGKTATCSKDVAVGDESDSGFIKRILYAVGDDNLWVTSDSGNTWQNYAIASTGLCIDAYIADVEGPVIFGCANGILYRAYEFGTTITEVNTFDDPVTTCYVNQSDQAMWLVGTSGGELWLTDDEGASWTLLKTFDGALARIAFIDPTDSAHIIAPGEVYYQESFDSGSGWTDLLTNFSNGAMTNVNYAAWHFLQHIAVAVANGTVPAGYSADSGITWSPSVGLAGIPLAITGGIDDPGSFAISMQGDVVYTALDGINYTAGGAFYGSFNQALDLRYDTVAPFSMFAGG